MRDIYEEIQRINALDPVTPSLRFCKLFEEAGELAQAVNKKLGRKVVKETEEELLDLICEETADTIQCVLSLMDSFDVQFDRVEHLFYDGANLEDIPTDEALMKLSKHVGCISYELEKTGVVTITSIEKCIEKAFILASHYGIKESEVIARMPGKNAKWEQVTNDRNNKS